MSASCLFLLQPDGSGAKIHVPMVKRESDSHNLQTIKKRPGRNDTIWEMIRLIFSANLQFEGNRHTTKNSCKRDIYRQIRVTFLFQYANMRHII